MSRVYEPQKPNSFSVGLAHACWKDCDEEGYPEIFPYNGTENGFHKIGMFDPFANEIENAIKEYQEDMLKSGKARMVNGIFVKVA